jgi:hypothetical protein
LENWEFCYERSIGCVGILKDWLSRTLNDVLEQNADAITITIKDLERHAWSAEQCLIMIAEAREEEQKLRSKPGKDVELRAALGLSVAYAPEHNSPPDKPTTKKVKGVGKPSPRRRPVGEDQFVSQ